LFRERVVIGDLPGGLLRRTPPGRQSRAYIGSSSERGRTRVGTNVRRQRGAGWSPESLRVRSRAYPSPLESPLAFSLRVPQRDARQPMPSHEGDVNRGPDVSSQLRRAVRPSSVRRAWCSLTLCGTVPRWVPHSIRIRRNSGAATSLIV